MELRHLRYFVAVSEHLNFSKAALSLGIAQPAISQQIADLEYELGVRLFDRNKRMVKLTDAGKALYERIPPIFNELERTKRAVIRAEQGEIGQLCVGFLGPATFNYLPQTIKEFTQAFPDIDLSLYSMGPTQQLEALSKGQISFGITRFFDKKLFPQFEYEVLYHECLTIVLPKDHPLAAASTINITDLRKEPIIVYKRAGAPRIYDKIISTFHKQKVNPQISYNADSFQTLLCLVESGCGLGVATEAIENLGHRNLVFKPIEGEKKDVELVCMWRADNKTPALQNFLAILKEKCQISR